MKLLRNLLRGALAVAIILVAYIGFYVADSFCGGYSLKPQPSDRAMWKDGGNGNILRSSTRIVWQPRVGHDTAGNSNVLGQLIWKPLLALDRKFWHPSADMGDKEFSKWLKSLPSEKVHPFDRELHEEWQVQD